MKLTLHPSWERYLNDELSKEYFCRLLDFLDKEYSSKVIYPPISEVFAAFNTTPLEGVKVVILGQDPYHQPNQAHGLSFSVNDGVKFPRSLRNIFKELESDLSIVTPTSGSLVKWAKEGVLLLNNTLTVEASQPLSHQKRGWELFTDKVIEVISKERDNVVFILWGSHAQKKGATIDENRHFVIRGHHPSPLSAYRGFFGSKPFSKCNDYLTSRGIAPINWEL